MHPDMQEFLEILSGKNKAESTIEGYRKGLVLYSNWLDEEQMEPEQVGKRDLQRYLTYLKRDKGYAPKTIRVNFVPVSLFYDDFSDSDRYPDDPTEDIKISDWASRTTKREQASKKERDWLDKDELKLLVNNIPSPKVRNRLVVLFQYYTGLRRQEVCDVKLDDLDRENREVRVRGKGGKVHTARWQPRMDGLLTRWLDRGYRTASPYAEQSDYLFLTKSTPQLSPSRLNEIVREAAEKAGIQEVMYEDANGNERYRVTSHILRHSYAVHFLQNGGTIKALSNLMAHNSVTTTEIYEGILDERAKEEYEKYGPDIDW